MTVTWPGTTFNGRTCAVTNGSAVVTVTGNLAIDLGNADPGALGMGFLGPDERTYGITDVLSYNSTTDKTTVALARNYVGSTLGQATVTITIASPGVVTWTAHALSAGDAVKFSTTGALPTGLTAGTTYYVSSASLGADSFRLADTAAHGIAGTNSVNTSGSQSGVHTGQTSPSATGRFDILPFQGLSAAAAFQLSRLYASLSLLPFVTPVGSGAVGDGIANDTSALLATIALGKTIDLQGLTYRVTTRLTFNIEDQIIKNGTILYDGTHLDRAYDVTADGVTFENVTIDGGGNQVFFGLTGHATGVKRVKHIFCTFKGVAGAHAGGTTDLKECNQYAAIIDPVGTDFLYLGCTFQDISNDNTAANTPSGSTAQIGFCGGIITYPPDGSVPGPTQSAPLTGKILACNFLRISTVLDNGLSAGDQQIFQDADAVRFYAPNPTYSYFIQVDGCYFESIGKRAAKISASNVSFTNAIVFAPSSMQYQMVNPLYVDANDTVITNVKCYANDGSMPFMIGLQTHEGDGLTLRDIDFDYSDYIWQIVLPAGSLVLKNYRVDGVRCGTVTTAGVLVVGANNVGALHDWTVDDIDLAAKSGTHGLVGIALGPSTDDNWVSFGTVRLSGMECKLGGSGFHGKLLDLTIDDSSWAGSDSTRYVLEMGNTLTTAANSPASDPSRSSRWETIITRIKHIPDAYFSVSRPAIVSLYGNKVSYGRVETDLPTGMTTTYFPLQINGHGWTVDHLVQYGDHDIGINNLGSGANGPFERCNIGKATRITKNEALNVGFLYLGKSTLCSIGQVDDTTTTTAACITGDATGAANSWKVGFVNHKSSNAPPVGAASGAIQKITADVSGTPTEILTRSW